MPITLLEQRALQNGVNINSLFKYQIHQIPSVLFDYIHQYAGNVGFISPV